MIREKVGTHCIKGIRKEKQRARKSANQCVSWYNPKDWISFCPDLFFYKRKLGHTYEAYEAELSQQFFYKRKLGHTYEAEL